jgi:hypothetical protein
MIQTTSALNDSIHQIKQQVSLIEELFSFDFRNKIVYRIDIKQISILTVRHFKKILHSAEINEDLLK